MFDLNFTSNVLGPKAVRRLGQRAITQTIRSESDPIVKAVKAQKLEYTSLGGKSLINIHLDGEEIGKAMLRGVEAISWPELELSDADHGGFDHIVDLRQALIRAGFRFQPLAEYHLYRIKFGWL